MPSTHSLTLNAHKHTNARARAHTHTHTRSAGRQTPQSDTSAVVAERAGTGELDWGDETWGAVVRVAGVPPVESLLVCIYTCIYTCMYAHMHKIDTNNGVGGHCSRGGSACVGISKICMYRCVGDMHTDKGMQTYVHTHLQTYMHEYKTVGRSRPEGTLPLKKDRSRTRRTRKGLQTTGRHFCRKQTGTRQSYRPK